MNSPPKNNNKNTIKLFAFKFNQRVSYNVNEIIYDLAPSILYTYQLQFIIFQFNFKLSDEMRFNIQQ